MEELINVDKSFNEAIFLSRVDHIFIMLLDAIMQRDISSVKHYLSDEIYNKYNSIVSDYKSKNITRLFDEMNVKTSRITNINITDDYIDIDVSLTSRYMDYFIDNNGNYVSGINDHRIEIINSLTFRKKRNSKELKEARRCPNCGKTLDINHSGICPYCNGTFNLSDYDYILIKENIL